MITAQEYHQCRKSYKKLERISAFGSMLLVFGAIFSYPLFQNPFLFYLMFAIGVGMMFTVPFYNTRKYGKRIEEFAKFAINKYLMELGSPEI